MILMYTMCSGGGAVGLASSTSAELERLDWRLAIGEVSMNLRREVADKASREEMYSAIRTELGILEQQVAVSGSKSYSCSNSGSNSSSGSVGSSSGGSNSDSFSA